MKRFNLIKGGKKSAPKPPPPPKSPLTLHAEVLEREFAWLEKVIETRLKLYFGAECDYGRIEEVPVPELNDASGPYAHWVRELELDPAERLVVMLALAPDLAPQVLDLLFTPNSAYNRPYAIFGGANLNGVPTFLPTRQTALFLLAGQDLEKRIRYQALFEADHVINALQVWEQTVPPKGTPALNTRLVLSPEYREWLRVGGPYQPDFSHDFPAKRITSEMEWEEIVLMPSTLEAVQEVEDWVRFGQKLRADPNLGRKVKPGFKCLFTGPPGTGKTLTAALLGKSLDIPVYRVDLSMVVSKYIGETEKNLAKVFDKAEHQGWILFFDEADALFGKRSQTHSSNDRHANQEVSYLLQRVEEYHGLVILASNFKENIDPAFARRFQVMVNFPVPGPAERMRLWTQSFSEEIPLGGEVDLYDVAERYALTGAQILNVEQYCTLMALRGGRTEVVERDLEKGIRRELDKEGISLL